MVGPLTANMFKKLLSLHVKLASSFRQFFGSLV